MPENKDNVLIIDGVESFNHKLLFKNIEVIGDATFWALVDCDKIEIGGKAEFVDHLTCDDFICTGDVLLKNRLICRKAIFSGNTECYGNINSDIVYVNDYLTANGKVNSINVSVSGVLDVNRTLSADKIYVDGALLSKSKVRALDFKINYSKSCSKLIKLDCELATVSSESSLGDGYALICDNLTCYTANLDYTRVDFLFCESAKLGKGTYVRRLECHTPPVLLDDAKVDEIIYY